MHNIWSKGLYETLMTDEAILPAQDSFKEHAYRLTDINAVNLSLSLDAMPIVCGDLHYDYTPEWDSNSDMTFQTSIDSFPLLSEYPRTPL